MQGKVKWSKAKKYNKWDSDYHFSAHKCGYDCKVEFTHWKNKFYYSIITPYNTAYNSLWDNKEYETDKEAKQACEELLLKMIAGDEKKEK